MDKFNKYLYEEIGKTLKKLRTEKSLSQADISNKIEGIGRTSISNLEQGKQQPPIHVLYRICHVLKIDIHSVLPTYSEIDNLINREEDIQKQQISKSDLKDEVKESLSSFLDELRTKNLKQDE